MKDVLYGEELKEVMSTAVNLLCDAVSSTLGPTGNNVLINCSDCSPFITNDGVTIAKNIESNDVRINTILEIVKEASLKTNEVVGDGTTTTLVLLQSIFNQGLEEIKLGKNPIILKKELTYTLDKVIDLVSKKKKESKESDLLSIATISANDLEIGKFISSVYNKMKSKYSIKLKEGYSDNTYFEIKNGYTLEIDNISSIYFQNKKEINLENCYVLVLKGYLISLEQISELINEGIINNKNIVIFAEDLDESIRQELLSYYLREDKNIFIFKIPEYASRRESIENDISHLAGCSIINCDLEKVYFSDVGVIDNIKINKDEVVLLSNNDSVVSLIDELKGELDNTNSEYEREFIFSRLSKLENGIATIYVGGTTKTEIKEKLMRYEDALCALEVAKSGVVVGEGITLLEVSNLLCSELSGERIIKRALEVPFEKICSNAGVDGGVLKKDIIESSYKKIYDFCTSKLIDALNCTILDPVEVVITSIKNAVSISSLLLTTNYLVIDENIKIEEAIL